MSDKRKDEESSKSVKNNLNKVNEPEVPYVAPPKKQAATSNEDYLTSEEFWERVEAKRKNFCSQHDIV